MRAARDFCQGLRIMRQPLWECLATFITSSMKQVAHIRQISQTLRKRYGKRWRAFDFEVHSFPPATRIAELTEQDLQACALGYRAKNLLATARLVASSAERGAPKPTVPRYGKCLGHFRKNFPPRYEKIEPQS